jgi:predicted aconitase with swiveling domain
MPGRVLDGRVLFDGEARGVALVLREPLSLWGGLDPETGVVIDAHHPQRGTVLTDRVLVMPSGRGSSSSSSVLAEAIRTGHAPAAILVSEPDLILAVGAAVGAELYGHRLPVLALDATELADIDDGTPLWITSGGEVHAG